jgi:hypothetical protein
MVNIDAELAFIARRNVLLAGKIATMDAALWRWVHEEEEEGDVLTDKGFIELIANMLLQRPPVGLPMTPSTCIEQKYMQHLKGEFPMHTILTILLLQSPDQLGLRQFSG